MGEAEHRHVQSDELHLMLQLPVLVIPRAFWVTNVLYPLALLVRQGEALLLRR